MNTYSPIQVANWFISRAQRDNERLDPMKLLKLVYLGHGWHLAVRGTPLINETVEAWQYGPVVPSVYHAFKYYGREPIEAPAKEFTGGFTLEAPTIPSSDADTIAVLDQVWHVYRGFTGIQLSTLTHQPGSPWDITWKEAQKRGKVRGADIPDERIKDHFVLMAKSSSARKAAVAGA